LFLCSPCPKARADVPKTIRFGLISTTTSANLRKEWTPFFKEMEKSLGIPVRGVFSKKYKGIIDGLKNHRIDLAWLGNRSALEAVDQAGAEIFARRVDLQGNPGYWSLLIVHKQSPIKSLDDLFKSPGKYSFGHGDPHSTSGFLVPSYYVFTLNNIDPKRHFKSMRHANHETNALDVANQKVDVATCNTAQVGDPDRPNLRTARLWRTHPQEMTHIRSIWKSPLIPFDPMVFRAGLDEPFKNKVRDFFHSFGRKGPDKKKELAILAGIGSGLAPFKASDNNQLLPIRQLVLYKKRIKITKNPVLSPKQKKEKTKAIDQSLSELHRQMEALVK
jgi:phosphonate transport system substrate-binding protein